MRHDCRKMGGVTDWSAARTQLLGLVGRNDKAFAKSAGIDRSTIQRVRKTR
jgi:hypothetical protein